MSSAATSSLVLLSPHPPLSPLSPVTLASRSSLSRANEQYYLSSDSESDDDTESFPSRHSPSAFPSYSNERPHHSPAPRTRTPKTSRSKGTPPPPALPTNAGKKTHFADLPAHALTSTPVGQGSGSGGTTKRRLPPVGFPGEKGWRSSVALVESSSRSGPGIEIVEGERERARGRRSTEEFRGGRGRTLSLSSPAGVDVGVALKEKENGKDRKEKEGKEEKKRDWLRFTSIRAAKPGGDKGVSIALSVFDSRLF
ncbi:hypothetical protein BT69DRAFT_326705 [Atractiella rhizophila]|nr:hypothetical protein BT69DRAFT_326705 [Atractiella rhizophila]